MLPGFPAVMPGQQGLRTTVAPQYISGLGVSGYVRQGSVFAIIFGGYGGSISTQPLKGFVCDAIFPSSEFIIFSFEGDVLSEIGSYYLTFKRTGGVLYTSGIANPYIGAAGTSFDFEFSTDPIMTSGYTYEMEFIPV